MTKTQIDEHIGMYEYETDGGMKRIDYNMDKLIELINDNTDIICYKSKGMMGFPKAKIPGVKNVRTFRFPLETFYRWGIKTLTKGGE